MTLVVDQGKTLLIDGPISVNLISGKINILGAPLKIGENLVIREGKRLPLTVKKTAVLKLKLGEGASVKEVRMRSVPASWNETTKKLLTLEKPITILIMGGIDSGKTSFCTFLVNAAVKDNLRTCVIDADLGQSDVGPPSTVGFNFITKPIMDLFAIDAEDAFFVACLPATGI